MNLWVAESCNLSDRDVAALNVLERIRWGEAPECSACGYKGQTTRIKTRRVHRCKNCGRDFTVLSGTCFQDSKLPYSTLLSAMMLYKTSEGKIRAVDLQRLLGISYKTAFVLRGKLWEAFLDKDGPLNEQRSMFAGYWAGFTRLVLKDGRVFSTNAKGELRDLNW